METRTAAIGDARKIARMVTEHFALQIPQLPFLHFRIDSVRQNAKKDVWIATCSFDKSFGSTERVEYSLKVNSQTGEFIDQVPVAKEESKKKSESA